MRVPLWWGAGLCGAALIVAVPQQRPMAQPGPSTQAPTESCVASHGYPAGVTPRWGLYEVVRRAPPPEGAFDVGLDATVTAPSGRTLKVPGFYDGDGIWKVRIMPDEAGSWRYRIDSPVPALRSEDVTFTVVEGTLPGPVGINPASPHTFRTANGRPYFWNGDTEWVFLSTAFTQADRRRAIDFLAAHRVGNLLMLMVNDDANQVVYPWAGEPARLDHARFDTRKLACWDDTIRYMGERGIIADLWFYSDDSARFYPESGSAGEDRLFRYLVARYAGHWNVTWNLALEYNEYRTPAWAKERAAFVKAADPYDHLIAVHQLPGERYHFAGSPVIDHASLQRLGAGHRVLYDAIISNRALTEASGRPIPICHEEFFIEGAQGGLEQFRRGIWAIAMAGGCFKAASLGWWIGTRYDRAAHFEPAATLARFMAGLPFDTMMPMPSPSSGPYLLGREGGPWVAYFPEPGTVSLPPMPHAVQRRWFDPVTGASTPPQRQEAIATRWQVTSERESVLVIEAADE